MDVEQARRRIARLWDKLAVPAYLLLAWSWVGRWSNLEFAVKKMDDFIELRYSRLILTLFGFAWLGYLIVRSEPPPEAAPMKSKADLRLERMRLLLRQAAERLRHLPPPGQDSDAIHEVAWETVKLGNFLDDGLVDGAFEKYHAADMRERKKWEEANARYDHDAWTAEYLDRLSDTLTLVDLDCGFRLPESYQEYRDAKDWPNNKRPVPADELPPQ
jgi:hypothetical protein